MNNNRPFIYPSNTGIAYSFTDDGYFETAWYRFQANGACSRSSSFGSCPSLTQGHVLMHVPAAVRSLQAGVPDGHALLAARHRASLSPSLFSLLSSPTDARLLARAQYSINSNGSLSMNPLPFATDGRIQTENPCTPQTAVLAEYAEFEMWDTWEIKIDSHHEAYSLQAVRADIGKLPRCAPSPLREGRAEADED